MAITYTGRLSGVLRVVGHRVRFVSDAPRIFVLSMLIIMCGVCILAGCYLSRTIDQATADNVNNRSFTFTSGAVFNSALANVSTALAFSNQAQQFTLTSVGTVGGMATGTSSVSGGSCRLTVTTSSYTTGPQKGDPITLTPCTYNSTSNTLTVTNLGLTVTSATGQITQ